MPKISICIPAYDMLGDGKAMLKRCLDSISRQSFTDYEIVVSDNSDGKELQQLCRKYPKVSYTKNLEKGMAVNTNNALKFARGEIIKILYQDDYLAHENSLKVIAEAFKGQWLATGCLHLSDTLGNPHYPTFTQQMFQGVNTIGSPSVVAIKNDEVMDFDPSMTWLLDCDFYTRMFEKYGEPVLLNDLNVVMGIHKKQVTSVLQEVVKRQELDYMLKKYQ